MDTRLRYTDVANPQQPGILDLQTEKHLPLNIPTKDASHLHKALFTTWSQLWTDMDKASRNFGVRAVIPLENGASKKQ